MAWGKKKRRPWAVMSDGHDNEANRIELAFDLNWGCLNSPLIIPLRITEL